jgi:chaperonin GroEL (HSP60 family)
MHFRPRHDRVVVRRIATEVEVKEHKDRVGDALHATRAAVEEGILPGRGLALLRAVKALDGIKPENHDQRAGVHIVWRAIQLPAAPDRPECRRGRIGGRRQTE